MQVFKGTLGVRTVAIKVIHNNSAKEQARFVREIATLRVLHDKNVVMFLGACLQRNKTLLVMEYLPNGELAVASDVVLVHQPTIHLSQPFFWLFNAVVGIEQQHAHVHVHQNC